MAQGNTISKGELLLIGGSAGSLDTLLLLLLQLPPGTGLAVVVVIHRRGGESLLVDLLRSRTGWPVKEAEEKELICGGTVYVAPPDYHLLIEATKTFSLDYSEKVHYSRPAIDVTFETAAEAYGESVIAVLLSGANQDGTQGLQKIKERGGYVLVQDPDDAPVRYMPQHALDHCAVDSVVAGKDLAASIRQRLQT